MKESKGEEKWDFKYAYYLKVRIREDCYKPQLINTINEIFSTYRVY